MKTRGAAEASSMRPSGGAAGESMGANRHRPYLARDGGLQGYVGGGRGMGADGMHGGLLPQRADLLGCEA